MRHPDEIQLALFAGGDLGTWDRWRVGRHVARCANCENEVETLRAGGVELKELAAELPKDLNWNRLAEEMTGNIRVGLAAGEAIAGFDKPAAALRPRRLGWNAAMVLACATVVFVTAFWINLPQQQAEHLMSSLRRIASGQAGQRPALTPESVVLNASSSAIEVTENGRTMSFLRPHSDNVTVSVNMKGSAGVRYVDADTGQVTTNKVYYAEQ